MTDIALEDKLGEHVRRVVYVEASIAIFGIALSYGDDASIILLNREIQTPYIESIIPFAGIIFLLPYILFAIHVYKLVIFNIFEMNASSDSRKRFAFSRDNNLGELTSVLLIFWPAPLYLYFLGFRFSITPNATLVFALASLSFVLSAFSQWRAATVITLNKFATYLFAVTLYGGVAVGFVALNESMLTRLQCWRGGDLNNAPLANKDLRGFRLCNTDLSGADLSNATLSGVNLTRATLRNAILDDMVAPNAILLHADLTAANANNIDLQNATLSHAQLTGAKMLNAKLNNALIYDADITKADLAGAILIKAKLIRSNFYQANLHKLKADGASFLEARLAEAILTCAQLTDADFSGADMDRTDLEYTVARKAKFHNAVMIGVKYTGADLSGAEFTDANLGEDATLDEDGRPVTTPDTGKSNPCQ